jgi:hypothetical protein
MKTLIKILSSSGFHFLHRDPIDSSYCPTLLTAHHTSQSPSLLKYVHAVEEMKEKFCSQLFTAMNSRKLNELPKKKVMFLKPSQISELVTDSGQ